MRKDIAIYGAGGLGRELALMIQQINKNDEQWNIVGFFDDGLLANTLVDDWIVLGGLNEARQWNKPIAMALAIADPMIRFRLVDELNNPSISFPTLIHPTCSMGDKNRNHIGKGVILTANVVLTTNIKLEDFVIVNLSTTIGHDVVVGTCSSIMPGCSISGSVHIGMRNQIGTGARFLQNISVGNDCIVGAGAVVTKSFGHGFKIVGVPAKCI